MAGPSGPPQPVAGRGRRAPSASLRSARISAYAAAARSSIGRPRPIAPGSARLVAAQLAPCRHRGGRRTTSSMPMARGVAAPCCMHGAAPTTSWRSASRRCMRTGSCRSTAARSWRPGLAGIIDAAWAIAETLKPPPSRSTSRQPRPTPASMSMCAAPGRSTRSARWRWPRSPRTIGWRASPAMANWWRNVPSRPCGWGAPPWCCRPARSCRRPRSVRKRSRGS